MTDYRKCKSAGAPDPVGKSSALRYKEGKARTVARAELKVEDDAGADLETVLAGGKELGADVIGFHAERHQRSEEPVGAAAKLEGESIDVGGGLRTNVNSAGKRVSPGLQAGAAPCDARSGGVKDQPRRFVVEVRGAKGGNDAAFESQPVVREVGERGVQPAEVGDKKSGAEAHVLVTDADLEGVTLAVGAARSTGGIGNWRLRQWERRGGRGGTGLRRRSEVHRREKSRSNEQGNCAWLVGNRRRRHEHGLLGASGARANKQGEYRC